MTTPSREPVGARANSGNGAQPRALVVDDEQNILDFVAMGLRYEGFEVATASDGPSAVDKARQWRPDVVILDIMLPGLDGLEVCRRLRGASDAAIVMLTARDEVEDRVKGLETGADDYVTKPFDFRELLARVRAVLRRQGRLPESRLTVGDVTLDPVTREVTRAGRPINLTPREFDLLELLMSHPRQVFRREAILNRVWGYDYLGESNVIDVYIRYLREKLGDSPPRLIHTVRGVGYSMHT